MQQMWIPKMKHIVNQEYSFVSDFRMQSIVFFFFFTNYFIEVWLIQKSVYM